MNKLKPTLIFCILMDVIGYATFAIRLTKEFGVAAIPVSAFYQSGTDNKVIRFCFAKNESTLDRAVEKLLKFSS